MAHVHNIVTPYGVRVKFKGPPSIMAHEYLIMGRCYYLFQQKYLKHEYLIMLLIMFVADKTTVSSKQRCHKHIYLMTEKKKAKQMNLALFGKRKTRRT